MDPSTKESMERVAKLVEDELARLATTEAKPSTGEAERDALPQRHRRLLADLSARVSLAYHEAVQALAQPGGSSANVDVVIGTDTSRRSTDTTTTNGGGVTVLAGGGDNHSNNTATTTANNNNNGAVTSDVLSALLQTEPASSGSNVSSGSQSPPFGHSGGNAGDLVVVHPASPTGGAHGSTSGALHQLQMQAPVGTALSSGTTTTLGNNTLHINHHNNSGGLFFGGGGSGGSGSALEASGGNQRMSAASSGWGSQYLPNVGGSNPLVGQLGGGVLGGAHSTSALNNLSMNNNQSNNQNNNEGSHSNPASGPLPQVNGASGLLGRLVASSSSSAAVAASNASPSLLRSMQAALNLQVGAGVTATAVSTGDEPSATMPLISPHQQQQQHTSLQGASSSGSGGLPPRPNTNGGGGNSISLQHQAEAEEMLRRLQLQHHQQQQQHHHQQQQQQQQQEHQVRMSMSSAPLPTTTFLHQQQQQSLIQQLLQQQQQQQDDAQAQAQQQQQQQSFTYQVDPSTGNVVAVMANGHIHPQHQQQQQHHQHQALVLNDGTLVLDGSAPDMMQQQQYLTPDPAGFSAFFATGPADSSAASAGNTGPLPMFMPTNAAQQQHQQQHQRLAVAMAARENDLQAQQHQLSAALMVAQQQQQQQQQLNSLAALHAAAGTTNSEPLPMLVSFPTGQGTMALAFATPGPGGTTLTSASGEPLQLTHHQAQQLQQHHQQHQLLPGGMGMPGASLLQSHQQRMASALSTPPSPLPGPGMGVGVGGTTTTLVAMGPNGALSTLHGLHPHLALSGLALGGLTAVQPLPASTAEMPGRFKVLPLVVQQRILTLCRSNPVITIRDFDDKVVSKLSLLVDSWGVEQALAMLDHLEYRMRTKQGAMKNGPGYLDVAVCSHLDMLKAQGACPKSMKLDEYAQQVLAPPVFHELCEAVNNNRWLAWEHFDQGIIQLLKRLPTEGAVEKLQEITYHSFKNVDNVKGCIMSILNSKIREDRRRP